ncbi:MAG: winged helix-turn-helix transcriptional regulator [Proteobacteria bacterium]|nr:winged helix-turn-helix transcriptional regulator [Pseudomonadota bacterium]
MVEILKAHPAYSRADIAEALGWKRDLVGYYLQRLKTKGVIERMGSNRKGYWVVKL